MNLKETNPDLYARCVADIIAAVYVSPGGWQGGAAPAAESALKVFDRRVGVKPLDGKP